MLVTRGCMRALYLLLHGPLHRPIQLISGIQCSSLIEIEQFSELNCS